MGVYRQLYIMTELADDLAGLLSRTGAVVLSNWCSQSGQCERQSMTTLLNAHLDVFLSSFAASFALASLIIGDECARSKHLLVTRTCLSVTAPQWSRFGPTTRVLMIEL